MQLFNNISNFSDKCLFNFLFWIPDSFCTFHYYGRGGTPSLASSDGSSLIFYHSEFRTSSACPEKQSCSELFHCVEILFVFQDFWATCAYPEKQSVPWKFSLYWIGLHFLTFTGFLSNLALAIKNPEIFYCIEYTFYIQDFWATCACPEKQSVRWIHCIEHIFFIIRNFEQLNCACPEKQSLS